MTTVQCVYQILNTTNGRSYIGSTVNFVQRKWRHFYDLKNGRHASAFMQRDYRKCGRAVFEIAILEHVVQRSALIPREQYWMDTVQPAYNSAKVAASVLGVRHSPAVVLKNKERNTGFGNGNARVTEIQAKQISGMLSDFTQAEIAEQFGVARTTVQRVCKRIGSEKQAPIFKEKARKLFSANAKKNIAGRNALSVYMLRSDDFSTQVTPSVTEAAMLLGIDISAVAKRLKRKPVSLCNGFYISTAPIDAATVAWPYRRAAK